LLSSGAQFQDFGEAQKHKCNEGDQDASHLECAENAVIFSAARRDVAEVSKVHEEEMAHDVEHQHE
jgi:hypothetical protein